MAYQRVQKFSPWNSQPQKKTSQFGSRPFPVQAQESDSPPTPQDLEDAAFDQHKFEATGLEVKEEYGTITPQEKEKLGVLRAKMNDFWVQRMERTKGQPNLLEILMKNGRGIPTTESPAPIQAKLTIGEPGDKYEQEADQVAAKVVNQINTPQTQQSLGGQGVQQKSSNQSFSKDGIAASADLEASIQQAKVSGQSRRTDGESTIQRWPTGNLYIDSFLITVITIILGWIVKQGLLSSSKSPLQIANSTTNEPGTEGEKGKNAEEIAPKFGKELDQNKSLKADVETAAQSGATEKIVQNKQIQTLVTDAAKENINPDVTEKNGLDKAEIKKIVTQEVTLRGKDDIEAYMRRVKRKYTNLTEEEQTAIRELADKTYFTSYKDKDVKKEGVEKKESKEEESEAVEPPEGYIKITKYGASVYLNKGEFELSDVALIHLVEGANTEDKRNWHRSTKIKGATSEDYYLHPSKRDTKLYLLALEGEHTDRLKKVRIAKEGHVSGGVHIFK